MPANTKSLVTMIPLFFVLMLDSMGLGILFPVLNGLIMDPHVHFLAYSSSDSTRHFVYASLLAIFMLCWFFGAAILGDMSDSIGRKKALIICLLGSFVGYLLSAASVSLDSLWLMYFGRIIAGFTAGSQAIAQAAIVDISTEDTKPRNIGLMIMMMSLGFVLGPVFSGVLSNSHWVSWFGLTTPLYFISIISALNAVFLWFAFTETYTTSKAVKLQLLRAIDMFASAFRHSAIKNLSITLLIFIFSWGSYFSYIGLVALKRFHFTTFDVSMLLMLVAMGFGTASAFLVDWLNQRFTLRNVITASIALAAVCVLLSLLPILLVIWVMAFLIGMFVSIAYSSLLTMFSNRVGPDEQGWVMGVSGSIMSLSFGASTFITGYVVDFGVNWSLWMCGLGFIASVFLMRLVKVDR